MIRLHLKIILTAAFFVLSFLSRGQIGVKKRNNYEIKIQKANILLNKQQYQKAADLFKLSFQKYNKNYPIDLYQAASAFAIIDSTKQAFYYLNLMADSGCLYNYNRFIKDTTFVNLHSDKRWKKLKEMVLHNFYKIYNRKDANLSIKIDSMAKVDQKWRAMLGTSNDTLSREKISDKISIVDSLNGIIIRQIVEKYGCPNYKTVGFKSAHKFWLLIQHQDRNIGLQQKVLPFMKEAVKNNLFSKSDYAYLIDRIRVNLGKKQVYGTQMRINKDGTSYIPEPTLNPNNLEIRRKRIGLPTEKEYIEMMNERYSYSLKSHKKGKSLK